MADLIDYGINVGDMNYVIKSGIILIILCLFVPFLGAMSGKFAAAASSGFAANLRHDMYYKIQDYSFKNIDKFSTASIVTKAYDRYYKHPACLYDDNPYRRKGPIMMVCASSLFKHKQENSAIYLIVIPVLGFGLYTIMMHAHPIFERVFKKYDKLNAIVQENLRGIRVVKSFVREDFEIKKFEVSSKDIYNDFTKAERILAFNMPLMQLCVYTCLLVSLWLSSQFIVGGEMMTGNLVSLITYTMQMLMSLMILSMVFTMIVISKTCSERVCEILNEEPDIKDNADPIYDVKDGSVSFKNVDFSYTNNEEKLSLKKCQP